MTRTEKTKFNQTIKEIEELQKKLKSVEDSKDCYYREVVDLRKQIDSVHAALDTLPGAPGKKVKIDDYTTVIMTISARLFAWISTVAFGQKIKIEGEE